MNALNFLSNFFNAIENDNRISITHIAIYAALLQFKIDKEFTHSIEAFSYEIMQIAKISGSNTYSKCVRQLHEYGYIKYEPTFKNNQRSKIQLINLNNSSQL